MALFSLTWTSIRWTRAGNGRWYAQGFVLKLHRRFMLKLVDCHDGDNVGPVPVVSRFFGFRLGPLYIGYGRSRRI